MSELPKGLPSYEFLRHLEPSRDLAQLFHYTPVYDPQTSKPILTDSGAPDRRPFAWSEIFGEEGPVEMEVGSGRGSFLQDYAPLIPDAHVLGSEWDAGWAHFAARRLVKNRIANATMLRGDIFFFLQNLVPADSVRAMHMYFPDPWPKVRHHKNRLMREDFMHEVRRVLIPGENRFYWGTDHAQYNEFAKELWANLSFVEVLEQDTASPTLGITTGFERKYLVEGRPIYRSVLRLCK